MCLSRRPLSLSCLLVTFLPGGLLAQTVQSQRFVFPHYALAIVYDDGGNTFGYDTALSLFSESLQDVEVTFHPDQGDPVIRVVKLDGLVKGGLSVSSAFGIDRSFNRNFPVFSGWVEAKAANPFTATEQFFEYFVSRGFFTHSGFVPLTHLEPPTPFRSVMMAWGAQLAKGPPGLFGIGVAVVNTGSEEVSISFRLEGETEKGVRKIVSSRQVRIASGKRLVGFLDSFFPEVNSAPGILPGDVLGTRATVFVTADSPTGPLQLRIVAVTVIWKNVRPDPQGGLSLPFADAPWHVHLSSQ